MRVSEAGKGGAILSPNIPLRTVARWSRDQNAFGGPRGDRTPDLLIANQALSQLS
jgi:hypothetical protein